MVARWIDYADSRTPDLLSAELQAMHQDIGMVKEAHHHKNLGDLGLGVSELLHGSGVKLQSGCTVIQR